jgi:hypothetical protein
MNLGQLFITLGVKIDKDVKGAQASFLKGIQNIREKAIALREKIGKVSGFSDFAHNFQEAAKESTGFVGMLSRLVTAANLARLAIVATAAAMIKLTMNAAEASEHLFKFSINTGMDTDALQKWQQQAGAAGVQAEEVAGSFKEMQRKAMEIQLGQADAGAFQLAGVSWTSDAETMMNQIEAMLKTRPAAMGTKLAADMGLSEDMISFLRMRSEMEPASTGLILSKEEIADLKDFNLKFTGSMNAFKMALTKLGAMLAPITKPLILLFSRFMKMTADLTQWFAGLGRWKNIILGIGAAIATGIAAFFFPVTSTVLMITAIIAGVALAIEDIYTFMEGGESFTGDMLTGKLYDSIVAGFTSAKEWLKENWSILVAWMGDELKNILSVIWDGIQLLGQGLVSMFSSLLEGTTIGKLLDKVGGFLTGAAEKTGGAVGAVSEFFSPSYQLTPPGAVGALAGNSGGVSQSINIQVDGAKNPAAVGEEIATRLRRETTNAVYQMPRQEM